MADVHCVSVGCPGKPGSGSRLLNVTGTSARFERTCRTWNADFASLQGSQATIVGLLAWIQSKKGVGKRRVVHLACHATQAGLLELHDGYLPIVQLAQILGQGNIIFGDCCFGGQRTGRSLQAFNISSSSCAGSPFPPPPELVGDPLTINPVVLGQPQARPSYNPNDAIVFTASQDDQFGWYGTIREQGQPDFYCGVFTAFLCHSLESFPTSPLGEHWCHICAYIEAAGNLWLTDDRGGHTDPYLHTNHSQVVLP